MLPGQWRRGGEARGSPLSSMSCELVPPWVQGAMVVAAGGPGGLGPYKFFFVQKSLK